jgi:serine/threonine protein kinase
MLREVEIMKNLRHPHIVQCYDTIAGKGKIYIVLELGGEPLVDHIIRKSGLSERDACGFFRQVASAIEYCHSRNVAHRDIKNRNILLSKDGRIKLIDFGLSNYSSMEKNLTTFCGTPAYASPEMILGRSYQGFEVDVWSAGVVLYSMIANKFPFENIEGILGGEFERIPNVSDSAHDLMCRMLETDPAKRITMKEVKRHAWCRTGGLDSNLGLPTGSNSTLFGVKVFGGEDGGCFGDSVQESGGVECRQTVD